MNPIKRAIIADHERQVGRHDQAGIYSEPAGDPGLTGPGSTSWMINSDVASIAIGGISAIVLEILHPSVMAGVQDQSSYAEDPFRRGRTTYGYVVATTFGSTPAAKRLIGAVKGMHARVNGTRPDGVPYRALDPELIGWVHTCIPWAVMTAYERFNRPLTVSEKDRYLAEQAVIGRLSGAGEIPGSVAELDEYFEAMRPKLMVTAQTLEFFHFLENAPFGVSLPGPLSLPVNRFQLAAGMTLAPEWARRLSGFENPRLLDVLAAQPSLHLYARQLRWAFGEPEFARLARERCAVTPAGFRSGAEAPIAA